MWDEESGVPLLHAVAAGCVVPMLFPTVAIRADTELARLRETTLSRTDGE